MDVVKAIDGAIQQCGRPVSLIYEGVEYVFTACIMPTSYSTLKHVQVPRSPFGQIDEKQYVYYGPLSNGGEYVLKDTLLSVGERTYAVILCHDFHYQQQAVFRRAILQEVIEGNG